MRKSEQEANPGVFRGNGWLLHGGGIHAVVYTFSHREVTRRPGALEDLPEFSGTLDFSHLGDDAGPLAMRVRNDPGPQWLILPTGQEMRIQVLGTQGRISLLRFEAEELVSS